MSPAVGPLTCSGHFKPGDSCQAFGELARAGSQVKHVQFGGWCAILFLLLGCCRDEGWPCAAQQVQTELEGSGRVLGPCCSICICLHMGVWVWVGLVYVGKVWPYATILASSQGISSPQLTCRLNPAVRGCRTMPPTP